ncbi:MAG: isopenicillin N synthase family dioxygenase [Ilumatobacteraceae bacterium]
MTTLTEPTFTSIPDVDLARWSGTTNDRRGLARDVRLICHEVGFFHVVGHGVPAQFRDDWLAALQAFFALPDDVKARIDKINSRHFRGWERVGAELTDNRVDHREQLDVASEHPPYPPDVEPAYLRLNGPNQWLPEAALPGFRAIVGEFLTRMGEVAERLGEILSVGLGLAPDHLRNVFGERPMSLAKLISYPPSPAGEAGVNAHHDAGFLTVLLQHGVAGLQAQAPDGNWIDVEPRDDAFVVNLGEMLQAMTGNYLVATTHRVITQEPRFSSAYFHGPDLRTPLAPLPLSPELEAAVAASPRHAGAGFMAKRDELVAGQRGTASRSADVYGQQLWNYYLRSYPHNVARHYPASVEE